MKTETTTHVYVAPSIAVIEVDLLHLYQATFSADPAVEDMEEEDENLNF